MDSFLKQALSRRRFVVGLFYANLLWWNVTYSQRSNVSFGACVDRPLHFKARGLAVGAAVAADPARVAVLASEPPAIHFASFSTREGLVITDSVSLPKPLASIAVLETARDGRTSYVLASPEASEVFIARQGDDTVSVQPVPTSARARRMLVADINNDRRKDLLFFGKSTAGVATLLGRAGGTFTEGPVLFPEISVSDMKTMDLNGDAISDVMLLNWLANELVLFYGITGTLFSEQVTVDLPGEPADLAITEVTRDRRVRAAITIPDAGRIVCLTGNSAGEFVLDASIDGLPSLSGVALNDVNGDRLPDVISSSSRGVLVALAVGPRLFDRGTFFGPGAPEILWAVEDLDGDGRPDLVTASRAARSLMVTWNARPADTTLQPSQYAVGRSPHGICVGDFSGDGLPDVAVANKGSATLSLLRNAGGGKFDGQVSVSVQERPLHLTCAPGRTQEGYALFVTHAGKDLVTVVNLTSGFSRVSSYSMPTGNNPYVLRADDNPRSRKLEIAVRYTSEKDASQSLSLFEQLSGKLFLERNLKARVPDRITALAVADVVGRNDLLVATHDRASGRSTVSLAQSSRTFEFTTVRQLLSLPDSTASLRSLRFTGNTVSDDTGVLLVFSEPRNAIGVVRSKGPGLFRDSLEWLQDVRPYDDSAIDIQDLDGDGLSDLAVLDAGKKALVVYYGERNGRFGPPSLVCPAAGVDGFAVGPLLDPRRRDLVLSHGNKGIVSVIYDPFRR